MELNNILPSIKTVTNDDFRLRTIVTFEPNAPLTKFSKKIFLQIILGYTKMEQYSGTSIDEKPIKISGIDKFRSKNDCIARSFLYDIRQNFFYSFAIEKPASSGRIKKLEIRYCMNISQPNLYFTFITIKKIF